MRIRVLHFACAAGLLAACSKPPPSPAEIAQASPPRTVASFSATITPPEPIPGGGVTPGRAAFTLIDPTTDGQVGANPANTIELRTRSNFAQTGANGVCGLENGLTAPVEINNYFPERLVNPYVAFTSIDQTGHALCGTSDSPPSGGPVDGGIGNLQYTSLAGSTQASAAPKTGVVQGGSAARDWAFTWTSGTFTVHGSIYATIAPSAPVESGWTTGSNVGIGTPINFQTVDAPDGAGPRVTNAVVQLCTGAFTGATCGGTEIVVPIDSASSGATTTTLNVTVPATAVPETLYNVRVVNRFDPGGGTLSGSQAGAFTLRITGEAGLNVPADGAVVDENSTGQWYVNYTPAAVTLPATWWTDSFQICSDAACTSIAYHNFGSYTPSWGAFVFSSLYEVQWGVVPGLLGGAMTADTIYWWQARMVFQNPVVGPWSTARRLIYGTPPTLTTPDGATVATTLAFDTGTGPAISGAEIQVCPELDTTCAAPIGNTPATGPAPSFTANPYAVAGFTPVSGHAYYWRARKTYSTAFPGPWATPQTFKAP